MDDGRSGSPTTGDLLAQSREAERQLDELDEGTPEWHRARLAVDDLARQYHQHVDDLAAELRGNSEKSGSPTGQATF
jgi:hypothetical protein